MLERNESFAALMTRVLARSESAARDLLERYEPYLVRAIRNRLNKRIRSKFDSLDFAQDVWASFFGDLPDHVFHSPPELAAYLAKVAQNKVISAVRQRLKLQKYNVNREESLDDSSRFDKQKLAARQPSPSDVILREEDWTAFLRGQPLVYRRLFVLLREGKTQEEAAQELGITSRTVRRVLSRLKPRSVHERTQRPG